MGKATIDGIKVIALSQQSPLGMQLIGLKAGEVVVVNSSRYEVETIE